jgi:hypothetical protein
VIDGATPKTGGLRDTRSETSSIFVLGRHLCLSNKCYIIK